MLTCVVFPATAPTNGRPNMMKRNSAKRINDLRNMLQAPLEPTGMFNHQPSLSLSLHVH
jgi:hypothetical protein